MRENWYRDVWLLLISFMLVATVWVGFAAIQSSRRSSITIQCLDSNNRHDLTIEALNNGIASLPAKQQQQAERSKAFTIALINSLAPKVPDCNERARRFVPLTFFG